MKRMFVALILAIAAGSNVSAAAEPPMPSGMEEKALTPPIPEQPMDVLHLRKIRFDDDCEKWRSEGSKFTASQDVTDYLQRSRVAAWRVNDREYVNRVLWPVMRDCVFAGYWGDVPVVEKIND